MHRYVVLGLSLAMSACAGMSKSSEGSTTASASTAAGQTMQARLEPTGEVPPPTIGSSNPTGTVMITANPDSLSYKVTASGLTSPVTVAHIHLGGPGVAGPVIVPLNISPGSDPSTATGEGTVDASAIKGKNPDGSAMTMKDLIAAVKGGNTYVNVHTQNNKPGEARGQITQ
jgi:hypothetical protein